MKVGTYKTAACTLLALGLALLPLICRAGLTNQEKAMWGASAQAPTTFAVPVGRDKALMAQAVTLIQDWPGRDRYMYPMPILTHTVGLIQTADPTALNLFGFKVTDAHTDGVAIITIGTMAYEGKIFSVGQQHRDADKRAHLLAYLLEQSAGVSTAPPTPSPTDTLQANSHMNSPAGQPLYSQARIPVPVFDPLMQSLQAQLNGGQYDAALATLDALRDAVVARQKSH